MVSLKVMVPTLPTRTKWASAPVNDAVTTSMPSAHAMSSRTISEGRVMP